MKTSLLKLQIGPVQDFIAQARSTRDLWSGSYLLSWLMAAGTAVLVKELEQWQKIKCDEACKRIISPDLSDQPLLNLHLGIASQPSSPLTDDRLTPNFTNILVAWLPSEPDTAKDIARLVAQAIRTEWERIAEECWKHCAVIGLQGIERRKRWEKQVARFPIVTWQITPGFESLTEANQAAAKLPMKPKVAEALKQANDTYAAQTVLNAWQLDAVRQLREFTAGCAEEPASIKALGCEKDSLTGREETVLGGKAPGAKPGEDWWKLNVESLDNNSPWRWLFRERQRGEHYGALTIIKRVWHWAYLYKKWNLDALHRCERAGKEFPFPSTFHIASHDPAKNESDDCLPEEQDSRLDRYFAVLAFDGDEMGKWLSSLAKIS